MKYSIKLFSFLFLVLFSFKLNAAELNKIQCDPQLQSALNKILKVPDAQNLITLIQKEGPISIVIDQHPLSQQFGAYWDIDERKICVSLTGRATEGKIIGSILFELQNAFMNKELTKYYDKAIAGTISRENFIRSIEYIEYRNSLNASKISNKGIRLGIFPEDAYLETYRNFEEHYSVQRSGGHSQWIGRNYDAMRASSNQK